MTAGHGVSPESNVRSRENECAPKQSANSAPGRLATSDSTGGPMPIMLSSLPPVQTEARDPRDRDPGTIPPAEAVPLLQHLLANAIAVREQAVAEVNRVRSMDLDKHWFVSDGQGYCAACALPAENRRHVPRVA